MPSNSNTWLAQSALVWIASASSAPEPVKTAATPLASVMITLTSSACRMCEVGSADMLRSYRGSPVPDQIVLTAMSIRQARETDRDALAGLLRACIADMQAAGIDQWDEVYPAFGIVAADLKDGTLIVAERAGAVIGAVTLNAHQ